MTPQITADDVYKGISEKADLILIYVRTRGEYSKGKIEGSINIPVDTISNEVTAILPDKNKTIYVYCLSGSRSVIAVDALKKLGYTNVFSMTSGLLMWRSKKYPLIP